MIKEYISSSTLLIASLVFPLSYAHADDTPNLAGQWTFAARIQPECSFTGTANLQKQGGGYIAELTAYQVCPTIDIEYTVRQECTVSTLGRQASVRCNIAEFLNGNESPYYYPDNFTLTIESSQRMHGALVSSGSANPAEWKRAEGGIS